MHFFEFRDQSISQFWRFFDENFLFVLFTYYFHSSWLETHIHIFVSFGQFGRFYLTGRLQIAIDHRKWGIEVFFLIWNQADHRIRIVERFDEHLRE